MLSTGGRPKLCARALRYWQSRISWRDGHFLLPHSRGLHLNRKSQFGPHRCESFPASAKGTPLAPASPPRCPLTPQDCAAYAEHCCRERSPCDCNEMVSITAGTASERDCFKGGLWVDGARLAPTTWLRVQSSEFLLNMCQEVFPLKQTESWRPLSLHGWPC